MKAIRNILFFGMVCAVLASSAQYQKYRAKGKKYGGAKSNYRSSSSTLKRNSTDVFPLDPNYRLGGPWAAVGITRMISYGKETGDETLNDTMYSFESTAGDKMGFYIAAGWYHSFARASWIHFIDGGVAYKRFSGNETFAGRIEAAPDFGFNVDRSYEYQINNATVEINATHHRHFSRYGFTQHSLGLNFDYAFSSTRTDYIAFPGSEPKNFDNAVLQLHYRLGIGWKASPSLLVIPSIETPLLTALPFNEWLPGIPNFNSMQQPLIISIRVMLLRKLNEDCNVPIPDGAISPPKNGAN